MLTLLIYTLGEKNNVYGLKTVCRITVKTLLGKHESGEK